MIIGLIVAECSCIMAGLGAYPVACRPNPGQGPSRPELVADYNDNNSKRGDIDFATVNNLDWWAYETVPSSRGCLKNWNTTVQYWMVAVVYKRFPYKVDLGTNIRP